MADLREGPEGGRIGGPLPRGRVGADPELSEGSGPSWRADVGQLSDHGEQARRNRDSNGVTLVVSHRFSAVRSADHIVVLAGGRVSEQGPHDQLVRAGGTYAELYEIQARGYR